MLARDFLRSYREFRRNVDRSRAATAAPADQPAMAHPDQDQPGPVANARDRLRALMGELRIAGGFVITISKALPDIARWFMSRDRQARHRVGALLRADRINRPFLDVAALDAEAWPTHDGPITVILPVYQGRELLDDVIGRLSRHTDLEWHLIAIDDASPDPDIMPLLQEWQNRIGSARMTLLQNDQNLGFVGTVNRGLGIALERGADVVLLNSDALVGPGWASRLLAPLRANASVASVTPMSNNAEIANVPVICRPIDLRPGELEALDTAAAALSNRGAAAIVPTGVGFCMAISHRALQQAPLLDTAFGRGYGEEVDWCQKTRARGWHHLLTTGVFVEHHGSLSFGSQERDNLVQRHGAIISSRYPRYDQEVQDFIANDPLRTQRLILSIRLAAIRAEQRGSVLSVLFGHSLSGGAEFYLQERVSREVEETGACIVLRAIVSGAWHIDLHCETGLVSAQTYEAASLRRLFADDLPLRLVYSCGVGTPDPLAIPALLVDLAQAGTRRLEIAFHDFFPISPSYTLLNSDGSYADVAADNPDPAHVFRKNDGTRIDLLTWRAAWTAAVVRADELTVFSQNSARIVAKAWPGFAERLVVRPHPVQTPPAIAAPRPGAWRQSIGVLGNIRHAKGGSVLQDLSARLAAAGGPRLVLIGNLDPDFRLSGPSRILGSYRLEDLPDLVARHQITCWFFPSIWPETFSYVTHEMVATGLPVWCFDIGAQADVVRDHLEQGGSGGVFPLENGKYDADAVIRALSAT